MRKRRDEGRKRGNSKEIGICNADIYLSMPYQFIYDILSSSLLHVVYTI